MSSIASPVAGGGSAATKQSGTAHAVNDELVSHPTPSSQSISGIKDFASSLCTTPVDQGVNAEHVNNDDNGKSLPKENNHTTTGPEPAKAPQTPAKKTCNSAHNYGELSGSDRREQIPVTHDLLTFPMTAHEEFQNNGGVSNSAIAINQVTVGNGVPFSTSDIDSRPDAASSNISTGNSAIPTSGSSADFSGIYNGSIPTDNFNSNILFGPELQKALFTDGGASADPKLPGSENASGPTPDGAQPVQMAPVITEEQVIVPTTPQRPPADPPRLVDIPMISAPTSPHRYAGPVNHNTMPSKPDTILADQLRGDFWIRYRKEMQLLATYKKAFNNWTLFTTTESNKSKSDYDSIAEQLKASAITAQVAWTKKHVSFEGWKASIPALAPIIANIHEDARALKAAEKQKAERTEFINDLRGKPDKQQRSELAKYENFTYLMTQSREREMWRGRVNALVSAQAIIDEQQRIAAIEAQRQKAEAEAAERQKKEAEAEEQRKAEEARVAEETRLRDEFVAATAAQAAEEKRVKGEARVAEAQREAQRLADQRLICQGFGIPEDPQLHNTFQTVFSSQDTIQQSPDYMQLQSDEPLDFDAVFADQDAMFQAGGQPEMDFTVPDLSDTAFNQQFTFPELPLAEGQPGVGNAGQISEDMAQQFFSADAQTQLPSISEVMSTTTAAVSQREPGSSTITAETPTGKKKAPARKKKTPAKEKTPAKKRATAKKATAKATPIPDQVQQQTTEPSFGLDQVMASDPFVCSPTFQQSTNNGQGIFNISMPAIGQTPGPVDTSVPQTTQMTGMDDQMSSGNVNITAQQTTQMPMEIQEAFTATSPAAKQQAVQMPATEHTPSGTPGPMAQQPIQAPSSFTMFMKQPSQPPTRGSLPEMRCPPSAHTPTQPSTTPASENKRKASISHGMEIPTKRRQSVNQQGAVVSIAQPPPVPAVPQGLQSPAQDNQTPSQAVQTPQQIPIDPALHFGISPPSGGMKFGTAIKAGVCTAIAHVVKEAKTGTVFSQPLLDGPIEDFRSEFIGHIKQVIKTHIVAVNATNPQDDQQAFLKGAFKLLQGILQEIERRGCVFKKALLSGPVSGADLIPARRGMSAVYQAIMAEYTSPPRFDGGSAQSAKVQQTPTRTSTAHTRVSSQSKMANGQALVGSPRLPGGAAALGTPAPDYTSSPQMNSHAASSSPMQPFPTLSVEVGYPSPMQNYPALPSAMDGHTTGYPQHGASTVPTMPTTMQASDAMAGIPEPTNYFPTPAAHEQQAEELKPKPKKTPTKRKSRARKASTAVTPKPEPTADNTSTLGSNLAHPMAQETTHGTTTTTATNNGTTQDTNTTTTTTTNKDTPPSNPSKQCIPRLYYQFTDGAFYMELRSEAGEETHHRMARGTTAAEHMLGEFVAAARAAGNNDQLLYITIDHTRVPPHKKTQTQ
ncbi:uncharacterized protein B0H64DRAFT_373057 [Chaetomium fimeti]|uniref:Uncharacterized protein n=1 Tax=Chaetomium fimeti TaxID=1854472 RepID=A0AAE0HJJ3_9PEZI|nr:hypothetical protein B0H64DRAFT_373057 [Chaetomium fimeti]